MPPLIAAVALELAVGFTAVTGVFLSYSAFTALSTIVSIGVYAGVSLGVSALQQALAKKPQQPTGQVYPPPSAQDVQQTIRQAVPPRRRHYGRVKVGGSIAFYESKSGKLYALILVAQGEIDAFEEIWLNDVEVNVDPVLGLVLDLQYVVEGVNRVQIVTQRGTDDQAAQSILVNEFPTVWSSAHRAAGVANALVIYQDVAPADFTATYPQGPPGFRTLIRGAKVFDPRDQSQAPSNKATWTWSDNPALCILDFLTHLDGMARPHSMFDHTSFAAAADICDQLVPLSAGGSERRYRLSGSYDLSERPVDVLARMLATCDGEIYQTPDGKYGLVVGMWEDPDITIEDKDILSYDMQQGTDALNAFNTLKLIYTSPLHDYQEAEAQDWIDETSLVASGEVRNNELRLPMVKSPTQARRLGKIATARGNPDWQGTVQTTISGLRAIGRRSINLKIGELGIDQSFLRTNYSLASDLTSVSISVCSLGPEAYEWNPGLEDGVDPTASDDFDGDPTLDAPTNFVTAHGAIDIDGAGTMGPVLVAAWNIPDRDTISHEINFRTQGAATWLSVGVAANTQTWLSGIQADGVNYEIRLRARGPGGRSSDWTDVDTVTASVDTSPTASSTGLSSSKAGKDISIGWMNPADTSMFWTEIYRATVNNFASATRIITLFGEPSDIESYVDRDLPNGTYYYWVRPFNGSGIGAVSPTGPTSQTVP